MSNAQVPDLTIEYIMRDPKWIGSSPVNPRWGLDGNLYFQFNEAGNKNDSLFVLQTKNLNTYSKSHINPEDIIFMDEIIPCPGSAEYVYNHDSDIYYCDSKGKTRYLMNTSAYEFAREFDVSRKRIIYKIGDEIFNYDLSSGQIVQILSIGKEVSNKTDKPLDDKAKWLEDEQTRLFLAFKENKENKENKEKVSPKKPYYIYNIGNEDLLQTDISRDLKILSFRTVSKTPDKQGTIMPDYVTWSGYTKVINTRSKVGQTFSDYQLKFYNFQKDTLFTLDIDSLPGIKSIPLFYKDYPKEYERLVKLHTNKKVNIFSPLWQVDGHLAVVQIYSFDNKDRWLILYNPDNNSYKIIDHQHDEAWIGGPEIGGNYWQGFCRWVNNHEILFCSEKTGYSHVYKYDINTGQTKALTQGKYEVQSIFLSNDKTYLYLITNQSHPGSKTFVRLNLRDCKQEIIIDLNGGLENVSVSPDEKYVSFLASYSNKPNELFISENRVGGKIKQITFKGRSEEFKKYHWREQEIVTFKARDGADVYARLYRPAKANRNNPAVIFVHGAGYLQNAHNWWSYYYREYMFHNLLADRGYTVLDIDYRASVGYGRDWRTAIYRHMGSKDLDDQVDGAEYLIKHLGVNKDNIGIYGGSYGGFITLMALFTQPGTFRAGAALRPVTDWAHYNHGYTSNILNTPTTDSIAYARSSPINFADGLKSRLLICHGMLDDNVHFQDVVRLQQVLIDKGKNNWELAAYPLESHGFKSPEAWTDEYKRILKLFEETINKP